MNANETKTETKTETNVDRPWWEVDGWNELSDEERYLIREDGKAFEAAIESGDDEEFREGFENSKPEVERLRREAREAVFRFRFFRRYVEAFRQRYVEAFGRLRGTPRGDGNSAADEVAARPGHRGTSAGGESGQT